LSGDDSEVKKSSFDRDTVGRYKNDKQRSTDIPLYSFNLPVRCTDLTISIPSPSVRKRETQSILFELQTGAACFFATGDFPAESRVTKNEGGDLYV
jgi:hypothetical protein